MNSIKSLCYGTKKNQPITIIRKKNVIQMTLEMEFFFRHQVKSQSQVVSVQFQLTPRKDFLEEKKNRSKSCEFHSKLCKFSVFAHSKVSGSELASIKRLDEFIPCK